VQKIKFRFNATHVDAFNPPGKLDLIFLDLTNQCNLRCRYCFNLHNLDQPPTHLDLALLDRALRSRAAAGAKNWFLSGGEPLCYPHLDEALRLFQEHGHRPKIATNGILLKPPVVDAWVARGVRSVQFSFDTLRPSAMSAINAGSPKNHRDLLENLAYAVASPLRVVASSVLTRANAAEIEEMMRTSYEMGIDSYTLYPAVPARRNGGGLVLPLEEQLAVFDRIFGFYSGLCSTRLIDLSIPCFERSDVHAAWKDKLDIRLHSCGAGVFNLKIASDGRVSTCICQDAPEFVVGDLRTNTLDEIWSSPAIEEFRSLSRRIPECSGCPQREPCRGGCRNEAFVFGSRGLLSPDPHCEHFAATKP
jgi:radical SAM protein with 4Fe4S-binding SPASM domain